MDKKELRRRTEQCQEELEYWRRRADDMRQLLDRLETDYVAHRADCCLVRGRRLRAVVDRVLDTLAVLEGGAAGTSTSAGRSSPTETSSMLAAAEPPSSSSASVVDFSRNMQRLANRANLKCMLYTVKNMRIGPRGYFVASFPYLNGTGSVSIN